MSNRRALPAVLAPSSPCCSSASATTSAPARTADSDVRLAELRAEVELLRRRRRRSRPAPRAPRAPAAMAHDGRREPRVAHRRRQAAAAGRDGPAAAHAAARARRTASSSSTPTTTAARAATAPPAISATATSSPSSMASSRWGRTARRTAQDRLGQGDVQGTTARRAGRRCRRRERRGRSGRLGDREGEEPIDLPALNVNLAYCVRLRGPDLPARQRLLEGDHPRDRLRRPADDRQASSPASPTATPVSRAAVC